MAYNRFMDIRIRSALHRGVLPAGDLRNRMGVSAPTLMRMVRGAGPDILRIGRARATQYGLRETWPGLDGARFPLFCVNESGEAVTAGTLITLAVHQTVCMPTGTVMNGLPPELADARPSGLAET